MKTDGAGLSEALFPELLGGHADLRLFKWPVLAGVEAGAGGVRGSVPGRPGRRIFSGKKITYGELERYVEENSLQEGDHMGTAMVTRKMDVGLAGASDLAGLKQFLAANLQSFSAVRENPVTISANICIII